MSQYAILRIEKRSNRQARAMAHHALRQGRPVGHADPDRAHLNRILVGGKTTDQVMFALKSMLPAKYRKDAVTAVDVLVSGSPEAMAKMTKAQQLDYLKKSLGWVADRFGGQQNIAQAVVHYDEDTPHLQALIVPMIGGRLLANKVIGGPAGLRVMQTDFAAEVGQQFGLVRGVERKPGEPKMVYPTVRRWRAAIAAAGSIDKIPALVTVPVAKPKPEAPTPGFLDSLGFNAGARAEAARKHKRELADWTAYMTQRQAAMQTNSDRNKLVAQLAEIGVAVYGKNAGAVGTRIAKSEEAKRELESAQRKLAKVVDRTQKMGSLVEQLDQAIAARRQVLELPQLEQYRASLVDEISDLERQRGDYR